MSKIEVLISTMNQEEDDLSLFDKMNLNSDAIIVNQSSTNSYFTKEYEDKKIRMYTFAERGVGLSRNTALLRSNKEICAMADDDMVYVHNYEDIILSAYKKYPDADFIIFNVRIHEPDITIEKVKKNGRVNFFNFFKFGTVHFTFKREIIVKNNIFFSLLFGGGALYRSGEDSLFLMHALKKGLRIYQVSDTIADVYNYESSWFDGYNDNYIYDKGALYRAMSPWMYPFYNIYIVFRTRKLYMGKSSFVERLKIAYKGSKSWEAI